MRYASIPHPIHTRHPLPVTMASRPAVKKNFHSTRDISVRRHTSSLIKGALQMDVKTFLGQNVMPVTGCSEPAAIAFAASAAFQALGGCLPPDFTGTSSSREPGAIRRITVETDRNVFRNAVSAVIPGMDGMKGPAAAAAAGIFLHPSPGINLLAGMTPEIRARARVLAMSDKVSCSLLSGTDGEQSPEIRVTVTLYDGNGEKTAVARIAGRHDRIRSVSINGLVVFADSREPPCAPWGEVPEDIAHVIRLAETTDTATIEEVYRGISMNLALARESSRLIYGLGLGRTLRRALVNQKGKLSLVDQVRIATAAAADARMGGAPYPVMSTAGSGNQGITALVPIGVVGRECRFSTEEIGRAGLISHLVTYQVDRYLGRLSPLCGCSVKAGMGAAAGITYLIGGGRDEVTTAINLMAATVTGTICDGAKPGCSLKIAAAAGLATESAFMAVAGMRISEGNGIIRDTVPGTFRCIGEISRAMDPVDTAVAAILERNRVPSDSVG